jgi:hypothetical protein
VKNGARGMMPSRRRQSPPPPALPARAHPCFNARLNRGS